MALPPPASRPLIGRIDSGAWAVMAFAIVWGYRSYDRNFHPNWSELTWNPGGNVGANFQTYRYAAELARDGSSFYMVAPPGLEEWAVYLYPPITVLAYYPFVSLEWLHGYWILIGLNVVAGLLVAAGIVLYVDRTAYRLGWLDVGLIAGLVLLSPFTFGTIYYGNINLLLALAVIVGFLALDEDRQVVAGTAFGLAALFKLFPALLGAWLLARRSVRAIGAATAVGLGGILAGVAVYGWRPTVVFFTDVLFDRAETANFVGGYPADGAYYVTIQRPLSHVLWTVFPGAPPELLTPLAFAVGAGILGVFYYEMETVLDRLMGIFATIAVAVTLVPALQWYLVLLFFPMVPLWYVWDGPGRRLFLVGGAIMFANIRPGGLIGGTRAYEFPGVIELVVTNVFAFATLQVYGIGIMLAACAIAKYRPSFVARIADGTPTVRSTVVRLTNR